MKLAVLRQIKSPIPKAQLYTSCSELPLARFRRCVDGDLTALVRNSIPATDEVLQAAWDAIFTEYVDLMRDPEQMYMLSLMRDIAVLESELNLSAALIIFLTMSHSVEAENSLRKMGYRFTLKKGDLEYNTHQLDKVVRQRKAKLLQLTNQKNLLTQHREKLSKGTIERPGDFDRVLSELSAFQGYRLDPQVVTVSEYAAVLDRFKKHVESSKKAKHASKWTK